MYKSFQIVRKLHRNKSSNFGPKATRGKRNVLERMLKSTDKKDSRSQMAIYQETMLNDNGHHNSQLEAFSSRARGQHFENMVIYRKSRF